MPHVFLSCWNALICAIKRNFAPFRTSHMKLENYVYELWLILRRGIASNLSFTLLAKCVNHTLWRLVTNPPSCGPADVPADTLRIAPTLIRRMSSPVHLQSKDELELFLNLFGTSCAPPWTLHHNQLGGGVGVLMKQCEFNWPKSVNVKLHLMQREELLQSKLLE